MIFPIANLNKLFINKKKSNLLNSLYNVYKVPQMINRIFLRKHKSVCLHCNLKQVFEVAGESKLNIAGGQNKSQSRRQMYFNSFKKYHIKLLNYVIFIHHFFTLLRILIPVLNCLMFNDFKTEKQRYREQMLKCKFNYLSENINEPELYIPILINRIHFIQEKFDEQIKTYVVAENVSLGDALSVL
ncbi:hypothetical protein BpHYR1_013944 [Brachionus plicatilis]|uniref:Uncharacterized protein n=1 Tax=Brachionus plicatilis TaxID=10195 RepID=A0A3M7R368_BRAPC|nr:hypothetical protein BpHYR1_013944 [Brachionus plicatilis]